MYSMYSSVLFKRFQALGYRGCATNYHCEGPTVISVQYRGARSTDGYRVWLSRGKRARYRANERETPCLPRRQTPFFLLNYMHISDPLFSCVACCCAHPGRSIPQCSTPPTATRSPRWRALQRPQTCDSRPQPLSGAVNLRARQALC
jgi:hypothetical protein